jgi:DNA repair photolyase
MLSITTLDDDLAGCHGASCVASSAATRRGARDGRRGIPVGVMVAPIIPDSRSRSPGDPESGRRGRRDDHGRTVVVFRTA